MDVIDDIILREGPETNDPTDPGGRTKYGISERGNPDLWRNGPPTYAQARARYEQRYVKNPGFDKISNPRLREQLIDYGVNSGPYIAVQKLQGILGVLEDGVLGPKTLAAVDRFPGGWLNNQLVASRIKMFGRIVTRSPSQLKYLNGWLNRAVEFLV